jgi:hypothetical protein
VQETVALTVTAPPARNPPKAATCVAVTGTADEDTDTVAVALAVLRVFVTRTQKDVVSRSGAVVRAACVPPGIGRETSPVGPWNHWYVIAPVPVASTRRFAGRPLEIVTLAGCAEITGGDSTVTIRK